MVTQIIKIYLLNKKQFCPEAEYKLDTINIREQESGAINNKPIFSDKNFLCKIFLFSLHLHIMVHHLTHVFLYSNQISSPRFVVMKSSLQRLQLFRILVMLTVSVLSSTNSSLPQRRSMISSRLTTFPCFSINVFKIRNSFFVRVDLLSTDCDRSIIQIQYNFSTFDRSGL